MFLAFGIEKKTQTTPARTRKWKILPPPFSTLMGSPEPSSSDITRGAAAAEAFRKQFPEGVDDDGWSSHRARVGGWVEKHSRNATGGNNKENKSFAISCRIQFSVGKHPSQKQSNNRKKVDLGHFWGAKNKKRPKKETGRFVTHYGIWWWWDEKGLWPIKNEFSGEPLLGRLSSARVFRWGLLWISIPKRITNSWASGWALGQTLDGKLKTNRNEWCWFVSVVKQSGLSRSNQILKLIYTLLS